MNRLFTPREIDVAALVREGKTSKEIADLLNVSVSAVDFHRKKIRKKLGLKNDKSNLRSHLLTLH
jgi:DNA-binding CsgD family transcriptional regulator